MFLAETNSRGACLNARLAVNGIQRASSAVVGVVVMMGVRYYHPPIATTYARRLGLFDAVMVVIGGIIGGGIFLNPDIQFS